MSGKAENRKVVLYIAMSLDGYIAGPGDDLSFLSAVQKEGEDYGYVGFLNTIDTVIIGRKTYEWVMTQVDEFPHADLDTFIITRSPREPDGRIQFYGGALDSLINEIKSIPGKNLFIDGGAEITNELLRLKLIDEMIISVIPVILGDGVRLFRQGLPQQNLRLISCRSYDTGLVQYHYRTVTG